MNNDKKPCIRRTLPQHPHIRFSYFFKLLCKNIYEKRQFKIIPKSDTNELLRTQLYIQQIMYYNI